MGSDELMDVSNPDRRNLNVISLAIITYFIASGQLTGDVLTLQFVDVEFSKPEVLVVLLWIFFGWFWLRFHISLDRQVFSHLGPSIAKTLFNNNFKELRKIRSRIENKEITHFKRDGKDSIPLNTEWRIKYAAMLSGDRAHQPDEVRIKYKSVQSLTLILKSITCHEAFATILLPHLLALTAVLLGITHLILLLIDYIPWLVTKFYLVMAISLLNE